MQHIHITFVANMWEVRAPGRATTTWASEWDALRYARFIAERNGGGEIDVADETGVIRSETIGPRG